MVKILHNLKRLFRQDRKKTLIVLLLLIMLFSFSAAVILNLPKKVKGAWFNDSWAYRQTSEITNSGSAQTNYNIKLTVDTSTLISASKLQSDCDDIRITDETANLLKFWIEPSTCNTSSTIIWVKVPSVIVGTINLYLYYGNPGASTGEAATKDVFIREIPNLNGMWKIDESSWTNNCSTDALIDSSGNSNVGDSCDNGIGPTTPVTGKFGNAVQLTGLVSNQVGFYLNPSSGISDNTTFSVAFWVKTNDTTQTSTVMYNSYTGPLEIVQEDGSGGNGSKLVAIYGGSRISSTYTFSETTTWHHVVVTRSSSDSTLRFYVDGATAGTSTSGTPSTAAAYGSIGMKYGGGNRSFDGYMDEVSVFNKQLSPEEISDLYNYYGYATTNYGDITLVMNRVGTSEPSVGSLSSEESGPGPLAYWSLDEGADNTCSGGSNDACNSMGNTAMDGAFGSTTAAPTWKTEDICLSGKCVYFDGSNDILSDTSFGSFSSDLTASFWVKGSNQSGGNRLFELAQSATVGLQVFMNASGQLIIDNTGGPSNEIQSTAEFGDNAWHHVVVTRSSTTYTLYVDGKAYATSGGTAPTYTRLYLGTSSAAANFFKGFIDEVKIYNYVRTQAQINSDFVSRGTQKGSNAVLGASVNNDPALTDALAGYWKLDESSGNGTDYSGNASTLTDTNTVTRIGGKYGYAGDFQNSDDLRVSDNAALSTGNIDFEVSTWVNLDTKASTQPMIAKGASGSILEYLLFYYTVTDTFRWAVQDSGGNTCTVNATSLGSPSTGTWYFVTAWHDSINDSINIQVNNGNVDSATCTTGSFDGANSFFLGNIGNNATFLDGKLDDVRLYKRILTNSERTKLYNWAPGPTLYWKLDENTGTSVYDSSANGRTATLTNTPAWDNGKFGSGVKFSGSNQHIILADDPALDFIDDAEVTYSTWFKHTTATTQEVMVSKYNEAGYKMIMESDGDITCALDYDSTFTPTDSATSTAATYDDDKWHHVSCVKLGATSLSLYIDGVLITTDSSLTATNTLTNSDPLYIGVDADATSNDFTGILDEVKIYNYARTSKQVVEDLNASHPLGGSPVASQISYWGFDEQQGQTTNDKGLGDNDGTLGTNSSSSTDDPTWKTANSSSCKVNGCLSFDGGDYVTIGNVDELETHLGEGFTISTWAKSSDWVDSGPEMLIAKWAGDADGDFYLGVYQNKARALINGSNGGVTGKVTNSTTNLTNGAWTHLAMTWSGGASDPILLYVNGKLDMTIESNNTLTSITNSAEPIFIGARTNAAKTAYFNGQIDEPKIYNGALTANEILIDYNAGSAITLGGVLGTQDNEGFGGNAPIASWTMNENADDSCAGGTNDVCDRSGSGLDGAKSNFASSAWVPGKVGSGLLYDASDDVISVGTSNTLNLTSNLTIEAWIRPNSSGEGGNGRILDRDSGASTGYGFAVGGSASSQPQLVFTGFGVGNVDSNNNVITYDAWNHVVVTRSSTTVTFYVNGVQQGTGTLASISSAAGATARIGNNSAGTRTFDGIMDEVVVYDYARSQSQVAYDYNRGGPAALYKFDECQGSTAYNSAVSGSGLAAGMNGTITPGAGTNTSVGNCKNGASTEMWYNGATGKRNSALDFDGDDDYVTVADDSRLDVVDVQDFTITGWFKADDFGAVSTLVAKKTGNTAGTTGYIIYVTTGGKLNAYVSDGTDQVFRPNVTTLSAGTWYHFAFVYDDDSQSGTTFYLNAKEDGGTSTGTISDVGSIANAQPFVIGAESDFGSPFDGLIDDARFYNYALSANQIKQLFNNGATYFGPSTGNP